MSSLQGPQCERGQPWRSRDKAASVCLTNKPSSADDCRCGGRIPPGRWNLPPLLPTAQSANTARSYRNYPAGLDPVSAENCTRSEDKRVRSVQQNQQLHYRGSKVLYVAAAMGVLGGSIIGQAGTDLATASRALATNMPHAVRARPVTLTLTAPPAVAMYVHRQPLAFGCSPP